MILAELEVFHSRPIAPTRRVALGTSTLPVSPAPGFGGILLAGVVAGHVAELDPELFDDLHRLTLQLQEGHRIPQPRLRHRFQADRVGLTRSVHRLVGEGEDLAFELSEKGAPAQHILAAVYAAGRLPLVARGRVMEAIRLAMRWVGPLEGGFVPHVSGLHRSTRWSASAFHDPVQWAIEILGFARVEDALAMPGKTDVQRRFRDLLREAHPDHGGARDDAADRIAELSEARRILLAS
ncbi:MAG: J domain-containing protein [Acidimicrobiales bacterium]